MAFNSPPALPGGGVISVKVACDRPETPWLTSVHRMAPRQMSPMSVATPAKASATLLTIFA